MRRIFPWLVALLGLSGIAQAGSRDLIADCAQRAPAGVAGIEALERLCPGLTQSLAELGQGAPLASGSLKRMTRDSLSEFLQLTAVPVSQPVKLPDPSALGGILHSFGQAPTRHLTWWDRFKAWCLKWLVPANGGARTLPAWLTKLTPSAAVAKAAFYTLLGLIVIAVLFMVRNELRAAGLFSRTPTPQDTSRPSFHGDVAVTLSLEQVLKSPLAQRPALLLRLLVGELARQGRLESSASLTHREVFERARLEDTQERQRLEQLSRMAELQMYGGALIEPACTEEVISGAKALYVRLRQQPGGAA